MAEDFMDEDYCLECGADLDPDVSVCFCVVCAERIDRELEDLIDE